MRSDRPCNVTRQQPDHSLNRHIHSDIYIHLSALIYRFIFSPPPSPLLFPLSQVLQGKKVLSLPVVDEEGEYVGVLSMKDIAAGLHRTVSGKPIPLHSPTLSFPPLTNPLPLSLSHLKANLGANYIEELELGSVSVEEITNIGFFFMGKQVSTLMHDADIWMKGDADSNLLR